MVRLFCSRCGLAVASLEDGAAYALSLNVVLSDGTLVEVHRSVCHDFDFEVRTLVLGERGSAAFDAG